MKNTKRKVNIKDVAAAAEVSIATVSRVLNGKTEHIRPETEQRVRQVVSELGYIPNDIARRLKNNEGGKTLGLVLPSFTNAFPDMAWGVEDEAAKRGYGVFISSTGNDGTRDEDCIRALISRMCDGLIYASSNYTAGEQLILHSNVPVVVLDRKLGAGKNEEQGSVAIDNYSAMYEIGQLVAKRGCKKIGYITANTKLSPGAERFSGLCDGLKDAGITFDMRLLVEDEFSLRAGYDGAMSLLQRDSEIDCIVCGNDTIAMGAMELCNERGILIPQQMKLVGFDDIYPAKYLTPKLTTVRLNAYEMGRVASAMLIEHLESGEPLTEKVLDHQLVIRQSL